MSWFRPFLLALLALAVALGSGSVIYAKCRCDRVCRKQCRQEHRAARQGREFQTPATYRADSYSYPDSIQPVGANAVGRPPAQTARKPEAPAGYHFECNGYRCRLVRDPVKPAPAPDPKPVPPPPPKEPQPQTKVNLPDPVPPVKSPPPVRVGLR